MPGALVALIGVVYIGLEFVPSIEPPANMRYVELWNVEHSTSFILTRLSGMRIMAGAPSRYKRDRVSPSLRPRLGELHALFPIEHAWAAGTREESIGHC